VLERESTSPSRRYQGDLIRAGGTASISSYSHAQPTEPGETPELQETAASPVQIELTSSARQRISEDLFTLTRSDGLEAGGFLFGPKFDGLTGPIRITSATRTWNAQRGEASLLLDTKAWIETEQQIAREGRDEELIGCWHCHPDTHDRRPHAPTSQPGRACSTSTTAAHGAPEPTSV
jgi:Prokaryotic homologs of the JAB domain